MKSNGKSQISRPKGPPFGLKWAKFGTKVSKTWHFQPILENGPHDSFKKPGQSSGAEERAGPGRFCMGKRQRLEDGALECQKSAKSRNFLRKVGHKMGSRCRHRTGRPSRPRSSRRKLASRWQTAKAAPQLQFFFRSAGPPVEINSMKKVVWAPFFSFRPGPDRNYKLYEKIAIYSFCWEPGIN